jgi:Uma2 family endonuclease
MSTTPSPRRRFHVRPEDELHNGDRLSQAEFHRRYEQYPDDVKFELIGGIVYMASPLRLPHSRYDGQLGFVLELYTMATPGTEVLHGATTILGDDSEPMPDLGLIVLPEHGGQTRQNEDGYLVGAPELVCEIAHSTVSLDLNAKKRDYRLAGVREYLVVCIKEQQLHWFHFGHKAIRPSAAGVWRSRVFPGLWLDGPALLRRDKARLAEVVREGLASPEYAAFAARLAAARR